MKHCRRAMVTLVLVLLSGNLPSQGATVITDNNLTSRGLGALTNAPNATASISNFATVTNRLVALQANIDKLSGAAPANGYTVDSLTPGGGAVAFNFNPMPSSYSTLDTLADPVSGTSTLTYNLNVGQAGGFKQYQFSATNITFFTPTGADAGLVNKARGNLVPNASFENPNLIFLSGGGGESIVADPGQQGSFVYRKVGTVDSWIQLPVEPGKTYGYDFWYKIATDNYGQIEYGLNPLGFSTAIASGNTGTGLLLNQAWTEVSGTFVPAAGQNYFYIGGLANTSGSGAAVGVSFDSFFVSELVPEPSTVLLGAVGAGLILRRRRWSGARR